MSSIIKKQNGFTAVEVVIIVVMAALILLAGWWVYKNTQDEQQPAEETTTQMQKEEDTPHVENTEDLENAQQYLEDLDVEGDLDTSELDNTLN